jgi:hypothetical protein
VEFPGTVVVLDSAPPYAESNHVPFTLTPPGDVAAVTACSPSSLIAGVPAEMTVTGTGLTDATHVVFSTFSTGTINHQGDTSITFNTAQGTGIPSTPGSYKVGVYIDGITLVESDTALVTVT